MNMEIQYYGANGIRIITKKSNIVIDPVSDITNISIDTKKATAVLATNVQSVPPKTDGLFIVDCPGEYEFEDYSLQGIAAQPHTATSGDESATMYRITTNGISVLVTGHINEKLSELQLEAIGVVDVVIVPVGGGGCLDGGLVVWGDDGDFEVAQGCSADGGSGLEAFVPGAGEGGGEVGRLQEVFLHDAQSVDAGGGQVAACGVYSCADGVHGGDQDVALVGEVWVLVVAFG